MVLSLRGPRRRSGWPFLIESVNIDDFQPIGVQAGPCSVDRGEIITSFDFDFIQQGEQSIESNEGGGRRGVSQSDPYSASFRAKLSNCRELLKGNVVQAITIALQHRGAEAFCEVPSKARVSEKSFSVCAKLRDFRTSGVQLIGEPLQHDQHKSAKREGLRLPLRG
ncbi:hypothetical protein BN946_scf184887.g6 [Trametes cinnabarina]|uniref:Uncharacterized protein n=1 Tax=Pycnoporus cinnabarinus TaxID=5643 RepID=A0A060T074_PYCCI|nr:hypothetical protein BN946_scf184887.g6 [Trametes cinnabarina]